MNLRCWWFGCERHPDDWSPPDASSCFRCGGYVEYGDMVGDTRHNRMKDRLLSTYRMFWPKRCTDCGRKWRACDDSIDHIPF